MIVGEWLDRQDSHTGLSDRILIAKLCASSRASPVRDTSAGHSGQ
jgi:hypothetical protein